MATWLKNKHDAGEEIEKYRVGKVSTICRQKESVGGTLEAFRRGGGGLMERLRSTEWSPQLGHSPQGICGNHFHFCRATRGNLSILLLHACLVGPHLSNPSRGRELKIAVGPARAVALPIMFSGQGIATTCG